MARTKTFLIKLSENRPAVFASVMVVLMLLAKVPFTPIIAAAGGPLTSEMTIAGGVVLVLISFVLLPVETFIGQALPISILRRLGVVRWSWLCFASAIVFGGFHLVAGWSGFFIGFGGGLALGLCWLASREHSFWWAFWLTTIVHVIHNAVALLIAVSLMMFVG